MFFSKKFFSQTTTTKVEYVIKNMKQEMTMCICIDVNRYINKQKHKNVIKNIQNAGGGEGGGGGAF